MSIILRSLPAFAVLALVAAAPAQAQDATVAADAPLSSVPDSALAKDSFMIGVGAATVPTYEGSGKNHIVPAGIVRGKISGYTFQTQGTWLYIDVIKDQPGPVWELSAGPVVAVDFNRTVKDSGNAQVDALGKKKTAVELGGYLGIGKTGLITSDFDNLSLQVAYVHDVTSINHSYLINPQITYGTPLSTKAYVGLSGGATYAGKGYAQTYFGVDTAGALRSGLPVYSPGSGWKNWSVTALANYSLTGNLLHGLSVIGGVSYSRELGDFANSPLVNLVGDKSQWLGAVGLAYTF